MKLSSIYKNRAVYGVAYTTGHKRDDEIELEFVEETFFYSYEEAHKFMESLDRKNFLDLLVVKVTGMEHLTVR
jgi:hypothetical protein